MMQQLIVAAVVLGAVLFVARRVWRTIAAARAPKGSACDAGCGCATTPSAPHPKHQ